jgi:hypothetical protein
LSMPKFPFGRLREILTQRFRPTIISVLIWAEGFKGGTRPPAKM